MIVRKFENFEAFIATLKKGKHRPEMEYFEGREGIKRAYTELLKRGKIFLRYSPTLWTAEEDPLRDFRVQYFRDRKHHGIFCREITHDTALGRRYRSRDPFEYRQTILVEEDRYPFTFEKIIVGDTVACFQLKEERACFIRYIELAEDERAFFERLWEKKMKTEQQRNAQRQESSMHPIITIEAIPIRTRILSQVRDFFLSRRSLVIFGLCGIIAAGLTYGLYQNNANLNLKRIQDKVLSIAATGALQFDAKDLEELHTVADISKPEYAKVIYQLNLIRSQNPGLKNVYLMRPTEDEMTLEFIADADALEPLQPRDVNGDGIINPVDHMNIPGEQYSIDSYEPMQQSLHTGEPGFDEHPETDQWGTFLSGYGPIKNDAGEVVALFGVDMEANTVHALSKNTTVFSLTFLGLFLFFVCIRLMAFNRSLLKELQQCLQLQRNVMLCIGGFILAAFFGVLLPPPFKIFPLGIYAIAILGYFLCRPSGIRTSLFYEIYKHLFSRKALVLSGLCLVGIYWVIFGLYWYTNHLIIQEKGKRLVAIAATAASQINPDDLEQLHFARDMKRPEYQRVFKQLNDIRKKNSEIEYIYILRPTEVEGIWEFVVDADGNFYIPFDQWDYNGDNIIDETDENVAPGVRFDLNFSMPKMNKTGLVSLVFEDSLIANQWGGALSGSAPIFDRLGRPVAILAVDSWAIIKGVQ